MLQTVGRARGWVFVHGRNLSHGGLEELENRKKGLDSRQVFPDDYIMRRNEYLSTHDTHRAYEACMCCMCMQPPSGKGHMRPVHRAEQEHHE